MSHPSRLSPTVVWRLALLLGLSLLLRAPSIELPFERDEGEYAYIAQRWLAGEVPYQHAFDQKPPGLMATYAAAFAVGGHTPAAVHWTVSVLGLATLVLVFAIGRRLVAVPAALAGTAFGAVLLAHPAFGAPAANAELFMLLPLSASFLAALRAGDSGARRACLASGALGAAACLFKQPAAWNVLLAAAIATFGTGRSRAFGRAAAFAAGFVAVLLPVVAYFTHEGALRALWDGVVGYNLAYASHVPLRQYPEAIWLGLHGSLRPFWLVYALGAVGLVTLLFRACRGAAPEEARNARLLLAWLAVSLAGVSTGGYFREHYYLQAAPPLAILAGLGAWKIVSVQVASARRRVAMDVLVAVVIAYAVVSAPRYFLEADPALRSRGMYGENAFAESPHVARLVADLSRPSDSVFVFGSEPQIPFYANRRSASRYIYVYPLMLPTPDARERQLSALAELRAERPRVIVTATAPTSFLRAPETPADLFLGLRAMLRSDYRLVARVPLEARERIDAVSPEAAERAWATDGGLGDPRVWGTLAVWERRPETPAAAGPPARAGLGPDGPLPAP